MVRWLSNPGPPRCKHADLADLPVVMRRESAAVAVVFRVKCFSPRCALAAFLWQGGRRASLVLLWGASLVGVPTCTAGW
jgi:hypothetical protein